MRNSFIDRKQAGGTLRQTSARLLSALASVILFGFSFNALSATYYIDYGSGSDSNSGTSKSSPWKHCPAMQPFSGSYAAQPGDRFIFKGGVVWPNAALPLYITQGGTEATPSYYGVDASWFTGNAWSRPVFDAEGIAFRNHSGNRGNVIYVQSSRGSADNLIIDNLEMKNWVWTDPVSTSESDGCAVYIAATDRVTVQNCYAHDWVVMTTQDSKFGGFIAAECTDLVLSNCIVKAPTYIDPKYCTDPTGRTSGCGVRGFATIDGCEFIGTSQGIWSGTIIRNNIVRDGQNSYNSPTHENGVWLQNTTEFYNNVIYNVRSGVGVYCLPGWGGRGNRVMRVFNNIFYNTAQINLTPQANPDESNELWFFNNIVKQSSYCIQVGTQKGGAPFGKLVIQNNIFVSNGSDKEADLIRILDATDLGSGSKIANNAFYMTSAAAALGMTEQNLWKPSQAVSALVDRGADFGNLILMPESANWHRRDRLGVARPQGVAWDIGAYEFGSSGATLPPVAPSSLAVAATFSDSINLTWVDNANTETGFVIERSPSLTFGFVQVGTTGANDVNFKDTGLAAATTYYYRVRAFNNIGSSGYAGPITATTSSGPPVTEGHPAGTMVSTVNGAISSTFSSDAESIYQATQTSDLSGSRAIFRFEVAEEGEYIIAAIVDAPGEGNNSLFINVGSEPTNPQSVWHVPVTSGFESRVCSWQGNGDYLQPEFSPKVFVLAPGMHDIIVCGREANLRIKTISLAKRPSPPTTIRLAKP